DPDVDPLKLKSIVGRPPLTECTTSSSPDGQFEELGEGSSRPSRAASEAGVLAAAQQPEKSLDPELLMVRLTLECDGLVDNDRVSAEPALRRERGEGHTDDTCGGP
ncbi:uncharacterized protein LOC144109767, partial [Amblyomma americanum]